MYYVQCPRMHRIHCIYIHIHYIIMRSFPFGNRTTTEIAELYEVDGQCAGRRNRPRQHIFCVQHLSASFFYEGLFVMIFYEIGVPTDQSAVRNPRSNVVKTS